MLTLNFGSKADLRKIIGKIIKRQSIADLRRTYMIIEVYGKISSDGIKYVRSKNEKFKVR